MSIYDVIGNGKLYDVPIMANRKRGCKKISRWVRITPVDGELVFNLLGASAGFVHFKNPDTGTCEGSSGISWFIDHAREVKSSKTEVI